MLKTCASNTYSVTFVYSEEITKLRLELNERHREENQASLEELVRIKEQEGAELKREMQNKIDALRQTVSVTKDSIRAPVTYTCWVSSKTKYILK